MLDSNLFAKFQQQWTANAKDLTAWTRERLLVRTDIYGKYTPGPICVKSPITDRELFNHFSLRQSLGAYCVNPLDDTCKWCALDWDNHGGTLDHRKNAWEILDRLKEFGIPSLVENSNGDGGYHQWVFWNKPIPASLCRSFLFWLLRDFKEDEKPEVFPKQDSIKGKIGNFVRIPGRHHKRDWVSTFTDFYGNYEGNEAIYYLLNFPAANVEDIPEEAKLYKVERPKAAPPKVVSTEFEGEDWWKEIGGNLRTLRLADLFSDHNLMLGEHDGMCDVLCPWHEGHSTPNTGTAIWAEEDKWPGFNCLHKSCQGRGLREVCEYFGVETINAYCESEFTTVPFTPVLTVDEWEAIRRKTPPTPLQDLPIDQEIIVRKKASPAPTTAYLWEGNHANPHNVTEQDRIKRADSINKVFGLIPAQGFLANFITTHLPTTELSCHLLLGSALSTLASLLGRRVWVNNGPRQVYPFLWVALFADSGERKSTGVNLVKNLLNELRRPLSDGDTTWAAFAEQVGIEVDKNADGEYDWHSAQQQCLIKSPAWEKGSITMTIDEIGGFLKKMDQTYNAGMKQTLTTAYESPLDIRKETREQGLYIPHPCFNLIGASTPSWLAENVSESDIRGGFLGRFTFFISGGKDYRLPLCDKRNQTAEQQLERNIEDVLHCHGELQVEQAAWDYYCEWTKKINLHERLVAWANRVGNMVIKLATLFAISERLSGPICELDVRRACRLMDVLLADLGEFVRLELPECDLDKKLNRIKNIIVKHGPQCPHAVVLKKSKLNTKEFAECIRTLFEQQVGLKIEKEKNHHNQSVTLYTVV